MQAGRKAPDALGDLIAQEIRRSGGWLRFDAFMAQALYAPGLGFYAGGSGGGARGPIGPDWQGGDFVTAPEMTPLFAQTLAIQVVQWLDALHHTPAHVIEFGAGNGVLAAGLLNGCAKGGRPIDHYSIVEVSAAMRERQQAHLREFAPHDADRVQWLDALPQAIEGVIIGNEVLDAMPVRLFVLDQAQVFERGVTLTDAGPTQPPALQWSDQPADAEFAGAVQGAIEEAGWSIDQAQGYVHEWPQQAVAWTHTVAQRLRRGAMLLLDYGFARPEFYHRARHGGTLMCHRRHRSDPNPLIEIGARDITAHVDFTAIARAARAQGLQLQGYTSQARFLINCGLLEQIAHSGLTAGLRAPAAGAASADSVRLAGAERARATQMAALQTLLSEAEMGELFKVLALSRGIDTPAIGFARGDRSMTLTP